MKYARFHPEYSDVREYFEAVGKEFGLTSPYRLTSDERMNKVAEFLGIDAADLDAVVESFPFTSRSVLLSTDSQGTVWDTVTNDLNIQGPRGRF